MDDVIYLINETIRRDKYGRQIASEDEAQVFCKVESISQTEFHDAGRNGLKPEFRFIVFQGDYNGEEVCEFRGFKYAIYRTYLRDADTIELYVERKGGTNGETGDAGGITGSDS